METQNQLVSSQHDIALAIGTARLDKHWKPDFSVSQSSAEWIQPTCGCPDQDSSTFYLLSYLTLFSKIP